LRERAAAAPAAQISPRATERGRAGACTRRLLAATAPEHLMTLDPRRSLRARLVAAFALVSLLTVGLGLYAVSSMRALSERTTDVQALGAAPTDAVRAVEVAYWT